MELHGKTVLLSLANYRDARRGADALVRARPPGRARHSVTQTSIVVDMARCGQAAVELAEVEEIR